MNVHAASHAAAAANLKPDHPLNPAQQARAAAPSAKGADFGALVAGFAKAKHAPSDPAPVVDPVVDPQPPVTTDPAVDLTV